LSYINSIDTPNRKQQMTQAIELFNRLIDLGDDAITAASWVSYEYGTSRQDLFAAIGICEVL
jgi:hypothetical protein